MPFTEHRSRSHKTSTAEAEIVEKTPKSADRKLKADIDEILDEIDEVLEDNLDMAKNYVQKGGEMTCLLVGEWDIPKPHETMPRLW